MGVDIGGGGGAIHWIAWGSATKSDKLPGLSLIHHGARGKTEGD